MSEKIASIKYPKDTRVHIPSKEEAGYEDGNQTVQTGKRNLELPVNPVTSRGQDPELFWMNKYGNDDREELLRVDIRSLYRHEHIAPETLIKNLYRVVETDDAQSDLFGSVNDLFGNALDKDELEKVSDYYSHRDGWTNRLIQGDSHLVMASLLEREGMAGQVQMIYMDPPYGIKYGSNWQIRLNDRSMKDSQPDEDLSGEPEVIKAFRDTWELGVHSYLSYVRDRLLLAKELLTETGSCFVQISDENVHLVRSVMDEVFGSDNFVSLISFKTTGGRGSGLLDIVNDYILWYAKDKDLEKLRPKYRQLFSTKDNSELRNFDWVELESGERVQLTSKQIKGLEPVPDGERYQLTDLTSQGETEGGSFELHFDGSVFMARKGRHWSTNSKGMNRLAESKRIQQKGSNVFYRKFFADHPVRAMNNLWLDTSMGGFLKNEEKLYVVQTSLQAISRCILMTTDPGDLVLDPTCGSGTTAFASELYGRRWITVDTSRISLSVAKTRLMTATFPYFYLHSENSVEYVEGKAGKLKAKVTPHKSIEKLPDIRQGFIYDKVPHVTLESIAKEEPSQPETLFDSPIADPKKMRVSGPFMVETLQNFEPVSPDELLDESAVSGESFEQVIKAHLEATGIKNGRKDEWVAIRTVEILAGEYLNAQAWYMNGTGEKKVYFHIGPKFGTVSKQAVNGAVKACQAKGDADWLVILGFSFESDIEGDTKTTSMGSFEVTRVRIHDDLLQEGLKKKPAKSAASFVTIGEPDIILVDDGGGRAVEIRGLDIYDPIRDEVKPRNLNEINYWMVDSDYDGSNFVVRQVYFCGGDKDEFDKWKKGISTVAKDETRKRAEKTLKIEIDEDAFDRIYGYKSQPIKIKSKGQKIAVRVISQYGEESTKVLTA